MKQTYNCLTTNLKEVVEGLKKEESLIIPLNKDKSLNTLFFRTDNEGVLITVEGGYITDKIGNENLGTSIEIPRATGSSLYFKDVNKVIVDNKYNLSDISDYSNSMDELDCDIFAYTYFGNIYISSRKVKGFLSDLYIPTLTSIHLNYTNIEGDINDLEYLFKNVTVFNVNRGRNLITGNFDEFIPKMIKATTVTLIANYGVYGNISTINNTPIKKLEIANTKIAGDLSSLNYNEVMEHLSFYTTSISGDISNFAKLPNLKYLQVGEYVYGDLSTLPPKVEHYEQVGGNIVYSWSKDKQPTEVICCLNKVNLGNDLDKYLINIANCEKGTQYFDIVVTGTKTEASNSAVATLKEKGYKVTINNIQQ